jgi:hypothetical protein
MYVPSQGETKINKDFCYILATAEDSLVFSLYPSNDRRYSRRHIVVWIPPHILSHDPIVVTVSVPSYRENNGGNKMAWTRIHACFQAIETSRWRSCIIIPYLAKTAAGVWKHVKNEQRKNRERKRDPPPIIDLRCVYSELSLPFHCFSHPLYLEF